MITGDNLAIARQIAGVLGIDGEIRDHTELTEEKPTELLLIAEVVAESLYGRLKPEASPDEVRTVAENVVQGLEDRRPATYAL